MKCEVCDDARDCETCVEETDEWRMIREAKELITKGRWLMMLATSGPGNVTSKELQAMDDYFHDALVVLMGGNLAKDGKVKP